MILHTKLLALVRVQWERRDRPMDRWATASEAQHVLDGLLYHRSDVAVRRHHTEGGGDAEHVFALLALLGFQFAPRIPDLKSRRLYSFAKSSAYPTLEPLIAGRINRDSFIEEV